MGHTLGRFGSLAEPVGGQSKMQPYTVYLGMIPWRNGAEKLQNVASKVPWTLIMQESTPFPMDQSALDSDLK